MSVDRRVLMFPPNVLLDAVRRYNACKDSPLPHDSPWKIVFDPTVDPVLTIQFLSSEKPEDGEFRFLRKDVILAMHMWCQDHDVPLPRRGKKQLQSFNGHAALMILVGHKSSQTDSGPVRIVSLMRKLCANLPPTAPRDTLSMNLWNRCSFCIVDSNTTIRRACRTALVRCGANEVEECVNENDFMGKFGGGSCKEFHVIIIGTLDTIPQEEFMRRVRQLSCPSHMAIGVVVTPPIELAEIQRLRESGFHGILIQPISIQSVKRVVANLLMSDMHFQIQSSMVKALPVRTAKAKS